MLYCRRIVLAVSALFVEFVRLGEISMPSQPKSYVIIVLTQIKQLVCYYCAFGVKQGAGAHGSSSRAAHAQLTRCCKFSLGCFLAAHVRVLRALLCTILYYSVILCA